MNQRKMRIGIIRDTLFTNEPRGINMAHFLTQNGFEVYVLCYGEREEVKKINDITLDSFYLKKKIKNILYAFTEVIPLYKLLWANKIRTFVKKYNIDILQVHDLYMLGPAIRANLKLKLPIVANFHENYAVAVSTYNWTKTLIGRTIVWLSRWPKKESKYLKKIDRLILLSEPFKQDLLEKYSFLKDKNIIVYPNVPDIKELEGYSINPDILKKEDNFIVFYFGIIAERRGIFTSLEAIKLLCNEIPVKLLLIGPVDSADKQKFESFIEENNLSGNTIHFNWRDISELPSFLEISDVCISPIFKNPQHDSGVANKIFQYMLFKCPLVVSDSTEQKRIVEETGCGLVHKSNDATDLAQKIKELYDNPDLRNKMGTQGREAVLKEYNTTAQSLGVINMYKEFNK